MSDRAMSFGTVAAAYERFRPGYPTELVDAVMTYAGRSIKTALEIGAGTGKASRVFAQAGVAVTASEPDAAMLAELRRQVPDTVVTVQASFEELPLDRTYGLVYAAAAMHWTRPEGRWARVAALLEPGGVFASFGGPVELADTAVVAAVRAVRAPYLETDDVASPDGTPAADHVQWPGTELASFELFTDVRQRVIERRTSMTATDYVGLLSTVSAYLELSLAQQTELFERIAGVLPERVDVRADITIHLARRI